MPPYRSLEWLSNHSLRLLDQRLLPHTVVYLDTKDYRVAAGWIRDMVVRGAPAIGATAAYALALAAYHEAPITTDATGKLHDRTPFSEDNPLSALRVKLFQAGETLLAARPTAVNLTWAVERVLSAANDSALSTVPAIQERVLAEAHEIAAEDARANRLIGQNSLAALPDPVTFIHHCNTGALATVEYGTALGIIRAAHEAGRTVFVYVDETRPRLQGARLTAWELEQLGIQHAIIADGASGFVMQRRHVDACVVGADRVAANGDTANKIGTFNLALAAHAHKVPFYVAAPTSTIDLSLPNGAAIPIEERDSSEVLFIGAERLSTAEAHAFNPAFDVTPAEYITAIVTEAGLAYPPFIQTLPEMVARAHALHSQNK